MTNPPDVIAAGAPVDIELCDDCIDAYRNGIEPGESACEARARGEFNGHPALCAFLTAEWARLPERGDGSKVYPDRYRVCSAGRSGLRALVQHIPTHTIVLTIGGPDRFQVADKIVRVLNASRTENPTDSRKEHAHAAYNARG